MRIGQRAELLDREDEARSSRRRGSAARSRGRRVSSSPPRPPYSSGNGRPRMSCSASSWRRSCGNSPVRSISAARGATRSSASTRTASRSSVCSSVRRYVRYVRLGSPRASYQRRTLLRVMPKRTRRNCLRGDANRWHHVCLPGAAGRPGRQGPRGRAAGPTRHRRPPSQLMPMIGIAPEGSVARRLWHHGGRAGGGGSLRPAQSLPVPAGWPIRPLVRVEPSGPRSAMPAPRRADRRYHVARSPWKHP